MVEQTTLNDTGTRILEDESNSEYEIYHDHQISYKPVNLNMRTLTYRNFFWKAEKLIIISFFNVLMTITNILLACFIPDGYPTIIAIGMIAPIQMIFIHMSFMSMLNMSAFLHKEWTKDSYKQFHDNLVSTLLSTLIYGIVLSIVFFLATFFYLNFFLQHDPEIKNDASTYLYWLTPTILFYVILTSSLKTFVFIDKEHYIRYFVVICVVLNLILPALLCFEAGMGVEGLAIGTFVGMLVPSVAALLYVMYQLKIFSHDIEYDGKYVLRLLSTTWRPTSLYTSITICKAIAYIAIGINSLGHPQRPEILFSQVLVFNLINFIALIQRSTGLSIGYRMAGKKVYYNYFMKYKKNLHKFFIKNSIVFIVWGTIFLALYPVMLDMMTMNNMDYLLQKYDGLEHIDSAWIYQLKLDLILPFVMMFIFHFGVLSSTCYSTFISSMVGKNTTFVHIMWLLLVMVIMMFTFGFDYIGWPSILSLVVPMGLYGVTMWIMVAWVYWWYITRPKGKAKLIQIQKEHDIDKAKRLEEIKLANKELYDSNSGFHSEKLDIVDKSVSYGDSLEEAKTS